MATQQPPGNTLFVAARRRRGWVTQPEFARAYDAAARRFGISASISLRQVRRWESPAPPWPNREARQVLQRMFGVPLEQLGFARPVDESDDVDRLGPVPADTDETAGQRRYLDDLLAADAMTPAGLEHWRQTVDRHGRATRSTPDEVLLPRLLGDVTELQRVLERRRALSTRRELTRVVAQMAGLVSLTLLKMGRPLPAHGWAHTAVLAAREADDPAVQAWTLAQLAYAHFYAGDLHGAVDVARYARDTAVAPCAGAALAAPLEARAQALLGRTAEVDVALGHAEETLAALPPGDLEYSAFGYDEAQLAFHAGNARTHQGDTARAWTAQQRALELYPVDDHLDRALIHLDRAYCLARDGDPAHAAAVATAALQAVPDAHRGQLLHARARQVAAEVEEHRAVGEVRELHEVLALPLAADIMDG